MIQIDNWVVIKQIKKNRKDNLFYRVFPIINTDISEEDHKDLLSKKWILKYMFNFKFEVDLIEQNKIYQNKLCIPMPQSEKY